MNVYNSIEMCTFVEDDKNTMSNYKNFRTKSISCRVSEKDFRLLVAAGKKAGLTAKWGTVDEFSTGDVLHEVCNYLRTLKQFEDEGSI